MTWADIEKRIQRLDALSIGLAAEIGRWTVGENPMDPANHQEYIAAIKAAAEAAQAARLALVRASVRMPRPGKQL